MYMYTNRDTAGTNTDARTEIPLEDDFRANGVHSPYRKRTASLPSPYPIEEYHSISDEQQGSSTRSSRAAVAADVILPEDVVIVCKDTQPAAPTSDHAPTESAVIAVLEDQQRQTDVTGTGHGDATIPMCKFSRPP